MFCCRWTKTSWSFHEICLVLKSSLVELLRCRSKWGGRKRRRHPRWKQALRSRTKCWKRAERKFWWVLVLWNKYFWQNLIIVVIVFDFWIIIKDGLSFKEWIYLFSSKNMLSFNTAVTHRRQVDGLVAFPGHPLETVSRHVLDASRRGLQKPIICNENVNNPSC